VRGKISQKDSFLCCKCLRFCWGVFWLRGYGCFGWKSDIWQNNNNDIIIMMIIKL